MIPPPRTADVIQDGMLTIDPDGWALSGERDSYYAARYRPAAEEFAGIEVQALELLAEVNPGTAVVLLDDYERVLGNDPCLPLPTDLSLAQRQAVALHRWTEPGEALCAGTFIRLGATMGFTVTIDEFPPSECGVWECGGSELCTPPNHTIFQVNLPSLGIEWFECGVSDCDSSLGLNIPNPLECVIRRDAPLFTTPVFSYS